MDSDIVAIRPAFLRSALFAAGEESEAGGLADEVAACEAEDCGGEDVGYWGGGRAVGERGHWVGGGG